MKKLLLCPPDYYDIKYVINPWMNTKVPVDKKRARRQYEGLKKIYRSLRVPYYEISPDPNLPDMVYSANYGYAEDSFFIQSNYRFPQRREEAHLAAEFFSNKFGAVVYTLPENIFFEGQGDLLKVGDRYFFGWGKRSMREAKPYLERIVKNSIIDFEVNDPYFYHLDTCFMALSPSTVMINPAAFSSDDIKKIHRLFTHVITVDEKDNKVLACNAVIINKNIVIGKGLSTKLANTIEKYGFTVHQALMSEYLKGGGSVKCLTLEIF